MIVHKQVFVWFTILCLLIAPSLVRCQEGEGGGEVARNEGSAEAGSTETGVEEQEEEEAETLGIILFIFFAILVGLLTRFGLKGIPIPYTGWLMIWGLVIGIVEKSGADWEHMAEGIHIITGMPPELFLLIFLPPIILASGISMDWHILKRNIGQVLLLATVGVVISAGLIALVAIYIFDYDWHWDEALTFGSMMAATDPVAVVALLKEVGASKRLGVVIEGESLFNDGTAQVFFLIFKEMIVGKERSVGSGVGFFCQLSFGGPAVGFGIGLAIYLFLTVVYNDVEVEISLTLCGAYLTYFLSEEIAGASGILAVVALGIFMAALGKFAITPKVKESLDSFWEMLEFLFNTLLFIYAGTEIAQVLYDFTGHVITAHDWAYAILLYVLLQVIRGFTILVLYPLLARMGYGITWKDAIIMTWGGLRGAVGLALALQIYLDRRIEEHYRTQVLFHMGVIAVLTLLINGTTTPLLLSILGVTKTSPEKLETLVHMILEMEDYAEKHLGHLKHDALMGDPDWDLVLKSSAIDVHSVLPDHKKIESALNARPQHDTSTIRRYSVLVEQNHQTSMLQTVAQKLGLVKQDQRIFDKLRTIAGSMRKLPSSKEMMQLTPDLLLTGARSRYIMAVKATYAEGYEKGYISVDEVTDLLESCDRALDNVDNEMQDWEIVEQFTQVNWLIRFAMSVSTRLGLVKATNYLLYNELKRSASLSAAFVFAHREAQKIMDEYIQFEMVREDVDRELLQVKLEQYEKLCRESNAQIELAVKFLKQLKLAYPEVMRAIKSRQVANTVLRHKDKFVHEVSHSGAIEEKEATQLEDLVERKQKKLLYSPPNIKFPEPEELLKSHFLFDELSSEQFNSDILPKAALQVFDENHTVFSAGEPADYLYIVVQGIVRVEHQNHPCVITESVGALVGIDIIQKDVRIRQRTMIAETPLVTYKISNSDFLYMMGQYNSVFLRAWQTAGASMAMMYGYSQHRLRHYTELLDMYRKSKLVISMPGDVVKVPLEALVVKGGLQTKDGEVVKAPGMIGDGPREFFAIEHTLTLILPDDASAHQSFEIKNSGYQEIVLNRKSMPPLIQRTTSGTPTNDLVQRWQNMKIGNTFDLRDDHNGTSSRRSSISFLTGRRGGYPRQEKRAASGPLPSLPPIKVEDSRSMMLPQIHEQGSFYEK
eukprot:TRINITY_DN1564_c0_g1_i3.p1 TRINITY_DN1564_c0_g1~~TRINITY_DN1564_c0_g1_i3.p1  ORF type:complete len:1205 (-),score=166.96 TRINITY_DN1564_c0_g1_i3:3217-6714(-)